MENSNISTLVNKVNKMIKEENGINSKVAKQTIRIDKEVNEKLKNKLEIINTGKVGREKLSIQKLVHSFLEIYINE